MAKKQGLLSRTAARLVLALTLALAGLALGPAAAALAQPPQLTIDFPEGSPTNNPTPQLRGTTDDPFDEVSVVIERVGGGGGVPLTARPVGEVWSVSPAESLQDGEYTAQATQTNGEEAPPKTVTFTVDTVAPEVHITAPANGAFVNTSKPTISGTGGNASGDGPVALTITPAGGSPIKANVNPSGGAWSYTPSSLPSVRISVRAEQADAAGNQASPAESTFTVKTAAPVVQITTPVKAGFVNTETPTIGGTAGNEVGDGPVALTITPPTGSPLIASVNPGSGGAWSYTPLSPLGANGTYTLKAEQTDSAGNKAVPAVSTFRLDTVAPTVSLTPGSTEKHTATPKFEGTAGTASGDVQTVTLNIYRGTSTTGAPPVRVTPGAAKSGKWSVVPLPALQKGTYTAQAEQADEAGNHGLSAPSTFTISSGGPVVTLTPIAGQTNNASPDLTGSVGLANGEVTWRVYSGSAAFGAEVSHATVKAIASSWSSGPVAALRDGTYTTIAEESDALGNIGVSNEATFTVDSVAPAISLTSPANGSSASGASQVVEGSAGTAPGDAAAVTVRLAAGTSIGGQILQTRVVPNEGGHWRVNFEGLSPGSYTTQAEQSDAAANSALSQAATFTLTPAAVSSANPTAAFTWVPSAPRVGQTVSLVSSSTAATSPIIGYAWDVAGTNAFLAGASTRSTVFSTSGNHVVHLSVSAADGRSSVATAMIPVLPATYALMRPFPIVRIVSSETRSGIRLRLLRVQAPSGSRISVTCHNRGCPVKSQQKVAAAAATGVAGYTFRKFQRALRAGVVLEIRVSAANSIGKYTRLTIRKGRLPQRLDQCLTPGGAKTMACPS